MNGGGERAGFGAGRGASVAMGERTVGGRINRPSSLAGSFPGPSPYRGVWEGLATFILGALGFVTMMFPLGTSPTLISFCVLCGGLLLVRRRGWRLGVGRRGGWDWRTVSPVWPALGLFFAWALFSVAWAPVRSDSWLQVSAFTYTFLPFVIAYPLLTGLEEERRWRIMRWMVWGMVLALVLFGIEAVFHQPLYKLEKMLEGTRVDLDRALNRPSANFVVLSWPAGLGLALLALRRQASRRDAADGMAVLSHIPWAWILSAAFFLVSLRATSASARVGFALSLTVFALARWSPGVVRGLLIAVTIAGPLVSIPVAVQLRQHGLMHAEALPFSFRHRVEIWDVVARRIQEKPLFGWGLESSPNIPDEGEQSLFHPEGHMIPLHPHNIFLQSLLELGAVGGVLYVAVGAALVWSTRRLPRWAQPTALAMYAGGVAVGCFAYGAWQTWWLSGILLAAILLKLIVPPAIPVRDVPIRAARR